MKKLLLFLLLLPALSFAQSRRVYYVGTAQIAIADSIGTPVQLLPVANVSLTQSSSFVVVSLPGSTPYVMRPPQFLNQSGTAYSTVSAIAALGSFTATAPASINAQNIATNAAQIAQVKPTPAATFAAAKAAITTGVFQAFLIVNNELFGSPTRSEYDGVNWHHYPDTIQNN